MARSKLERDINRIVSYIDPTNQAILTFDMLGNLMYSIGIYKILYNPLYHILCRPDGDFIFRTQPLYHSHFYYRKDKELEFHVNVWRLLKRKHKGYIDAELLIELILLLSTAYKEDKERLVLYIEELFKAADRAYNHHQEEVHWTCEQLVKSYKELNPGPLLIPTLKESANTSFSFNPRINERSRRLANKSLSEYMSRHNKTWDGDTSASTDSGFNSRIMMMYEKKQGVENMNEYLRRQKQHNELKECTFHPKLYPYKIRAHSVKRERKVWRTKEEMEFEECTFNPVLCSLNKPHSIAPFPKGYDKVIRRMRDANRERIVQKENRNVNIKLGKAPSMCFRKKKLKKPLLKIKVDISAHRKGLIVVKEGDEIETLVNNFGKVYQLSRTKEETLCRRIKERVANLNIDLY